MSDHSHMPNDLDSFWMPFTASAAFKQNPRMISAAKGIIYTTTDGQDIIDGTGGLWCCNAGHGVERITRAIQDQAATLDFVHAFGQGHPIAFEAAARVVGLTDAFDHVFFTNSGSEAVDTALKIALAFHQARGEGQRRIFVSREKSYHGINFGGTSVAGLMANRAQFGTLYGHVSHMRHTQLPQNAFSKGQPAAGAELADDLQRLCDLHGGHMIAAVIVEPITGAGGVLPPPIGYLERLREICDTHGILLIFDEVITGFGRLGTAFAHQHFNIKPDIMTIAKGLTNATVPMGGTLVTKAVRDAFRNGPAHVADLFHGYTYSGHPLACAAAIATLDTYRDDKIFENAAAMSPVWETMLHDLRDIPTVVDIRNCGILGAVQLAQNGAEGAEGSAAAVALWQAGLAVRTVGDTLALSPPLTVTPDDIGQIGQLLRSVLSKR